MVVENTSTAKSFQGLSILWSQGLRPIGTQVAVDALIILSLCFIINLSPARSDDMAVVVVEWAAIVVVFFGAVRLWDRWTISFLAIPVLLLQIIQRVMLIVVVSPPSHHAQLIELLGFILRLGSNACVVLSVLLCLLFPPLQLNPPTGPYPIGAVDVFLPRNTASSDSHHIPARIFYPTTLQTTTTTPYFYHNSNQSNQFLRALAKSVMPSSSTLHRYSWMFHTLKLIQIPASWQSPVREFPTREEDLKHDKSHRESDDNHQHKQNLSSLSFTSSSSPSSWPVVIHSHGLFGSPHMYTHQAITLASHGAVVVMVHHQDGSSPMVFQRDGSTLEYTPISQNFTHSSATTPEEKKKQDYIAVVLARRQQTHKRAMELLSVYESLLLLHNNNYLPSNNQNCIILPHAVSFQGKLNLSKVVFLGHSFGGATALTAAAYRPDITRAVVAHEPATDWMPDFGRKALFMDESRRKGSNIPYSGGTGGFVTTNTTTTDDDAWNNSSFKSKDDTNYSQSNLQDSVHMLVLYSEEWANLGWGGFPLLKCMYDREQFGPKHNRHVVSSSVQVIHRTKHVGFSDWGALTPLWLGRLMGSSSSDGMNPLQSLDIIMNHTMEFLHRAIKVN